MKKTFTYCAPGSGRLETYWNRDFKVKSRGKQVNVKGAPAIFYRITHYLRQGSFCRLTEFSRFPICLSISVLRPWGMGGT